MYDLIEKFSIFTGEEFTFLGICLIFFFNTIYFFSNYFGTKSITKNSTKASATVSQVKDMQGPNGQYQELTLIFQDEGGVEFAPIFNNMFKPRTKGQRVEILYNKVDPAAVIINDWRSLHMKTFISFLGLIATVFVGRYMLEQGLMHVPAFLIQLK